MSCCTNEEKPKTSEYLVILNKHFDEVLIKKEEKYQLLTLRDKARKDNYDWVYYLQLKVAYGDTNSCSHNSQSKLEGAMKEICQWIDLLVESKVAKPQKQLCLFGEVEDDELKQEPECPTSGDDRGYSKYWREREKVRKYNLLKQYDFFELFKDVGRWWSYRNVDFSHQLPKNSEEMIKLAKEYLSGEIHSSILLGNKPFEDEYNYLTREEALSDIELYHRLLTRLDFSLIPYFDYASVFIDDSLSSTFHEESVSHRYGLRNGMVCAGSWVNDSYVTYDFYDPDFLLWVRNYFGIKHREPMSDEYVIKGNIEHFIDSMLWYGRKDYDWKKKINTFSNWKIFKADIYSFLKSKDINPRNGGGSGFSIDGLSGNYDLSKKGKIVIAQNINERLEMGRSIDGLEVDEYKNQQKVIVVNIHGDDIYKKAFELFSKKAIIQTSLFDFAA